MIPLDPKIEEMDIKGIPLFGISDDSIAVKEVENIVQKLGF
jgi:CO dehydrogenase maturation factor